MWWVSLLIPNKCNNGFEIIAALEPVMANTKIMTKTCQFDFIFQCTLKFAIAFLNFHKITQFKE